MTLLPVIDDTHGQRATHLPHRYVVGSGTGGAGYAHLARSAAWHHNPRSRRGPHLSVHTLCGMSLNHPILTDDPIGPRCATCIGREAALDPNASDLAWRPQGIHWLPRTWCIGANRRWYTEVGGRNSWMGRCLACGFLGPIRGGYGWNGGGPKLIAHHHGGVGRTCPDHGRKHLRDEGGRLVCDAGLSYGQGTCGRAASPFWVLSDPPLPCDHPTTDLVLPDPAPAIHIDVRRRRP